MSTQQGREPGVREKNRSGRGAVERGTLLAQASPHGGGRLSIVLSPHGLWAAVRACSRTVVRENNADWRSSRRPRMIAGARVGKRARAGTGMGRRSYARRQWAGPRWRGRFAHIYGNIVDVVGFRRRQLCWWYTASHCLDLRGERGREGGDSRGVSKSGTSSQSVWERERTPERRRGECAHKRLASRPNGWEPVTPSLRQLLLESD